MLVLPWQISLCRGSWKGITQSHIRAAFGMSGSELHIPTTGEERARTRGLLDVEIPRL